MDNTALYSLAQRLRDALLAGETGSEPGMARISVDGYLEPDYWQCEKEQIFARFPLIAARSEELAVNSWRSVELPSGSALLSRDEDGQVRAFANACRHRGMPLLTGDQVHARGKISCPYHAWTYRSDGALSHVPQQQTFPGLCPAEHALKPLACGEQHGFIWVQWQGDELNLDEWLGGLNEDFASTQLAGHEVFADSCRQVKANWKICIDAFLEAYHVRVLHRSTVGPFFEDSVAVSDTVGRHFRSGVARKGLRDGIAGDLRHLVSFTHFVFPNQVFVFHPDYVSQMSLMPTSESSFDWHHRMLIPKGENTDARRDHWQKSFELIENGVFYSEDLWASERIQKGLETGANSHVTVGGLENLIRDFHANVDELVAGD